MSLSRGSSTRGPRRSSTREFEIIKQGEQDYACGLAAIASAARFLWHNVDWNDTYRQILRRVPRHLEQTPILYSRVLLGGRGWPPWKIGPILTAARLIAHSETAIRTTSDLEQFVHPGHLYLAVVLSRFLRAGPGDQRSLVQRRKRRALPADAFSHYVIVRRVSGVLVISDPHPWHDDEYPTSTQRLFAGMTAKHVRLPWIVRLERA